MSSDVKKLRLYVDRDTLSNIVVTEDDFYSSRRDRELGYSDYIFVKYKLALLQAISFDNIDVNIITADSKINKALEVKESKDQVIFIRKGLNNNKNVLLRLPGKKDAYYGVNDIETFFSILIKHKLISNKLYDFLWKTDSYAEARFTASNKGGKVTAQQARNVANYILDIADTVDSSNGLNGLRRGSTYKDYTTTPRYGYAPVMEDVLILWSEIYNATRNWEKPKTIKSWAKVIKEAIETVLPVYHSLAVRELNSKQLSTAIKLRDTLTMFLLKNLVLEHLDGTTEVFFPNIGLLFTDIIYLYMIMYKLKDDGLLVVYDDEVFFNYFSGKDVLVMLTNTDTIKTIVMLNRPIGQRPSNVFDCVVHTIKYKKDCIHDIISDYGMKLFPEGIKVRSIEIANPIQEMETGFIDEEELD